MWPPPPHFERYLDYLKQKKIALLVELYTLKNDGVAETLRFHMSRSRGPTCQPLSHRQGVHRGPCCRVHVVLLRHLLVQVEQHGAGPVERKHSTAGCPAEIQGVHGESKETERERCHFKSIHMKEALRLVSFSKQKSVICLKLFLNAFTCRQMWWNKWMKMFRFIHSIKLIDEN